jgi:hypothetical protein
VKTGYPRFYPGTNWLVWKPTGFLGLGTATWYMMAPFFVIAHHMGYPEKYLGEPKEFADKGKTGFPLTSRVQEYMEEKMYEDSNLPQWQSEVKITNTFNELERAKYKAIYMKEHPELYKTTIKWRHIRRWLAAAENSLEKYGIRA